MDWIDEAQLHLKKNNQVLFSKKSDYLQDLKFPCLSLHHDSSEVTPPYSGKYV